MTGWVMSEHGVPDSRLTVIRQVDDYISPKGRHMDQWLCQCSCDGKLVIVIGNQIKRGKTKSCGCLRIESTFQVGKNNVKSNMYSAKMQDEHGEYYIGLTSNTNKEFYIDAQDYNQIKDYCWSECKNSLDNYRTLSAWDNKLKCMVKMSWLLVGKEFDHIDRNPFNNRRYNLRKANDTENAQNHSIRKDNTSGVTGVSWNKQRQQWCAYIQVDKQRIVLGFFNHKNDAVVVRLTAEQKYFKDFAPQKHLYKQYGIAEENDNDRIPD